MPDHQPLDELRRKFLEAMKREDERSQPTLRQRRKWEWLRWLYNTPTQRQERENVPPIGPSDAEWLEDAMSRLDELDGDYNA